MINVNNLVLRRDRPDGVSQHNSAFVWPTSGFVGIRSTERLVRDNGCGSGLYGYSCVPGRTHRMSLDWTGNVWRLVLAIAPPVDLGNKVKYEAGHVLFTGTAQECRDLIWELGGEVPAACLGVDADNRREGFDPAAIVAEIVAGSDRRAADAGLWRIFRSIGAAGSPEALRERSTREWIAVGIPAGDARYMSGPASVGAATAYLAGWTRAYDRHDLQALALAGWTYERTAWVGDPTDPRIREYLLANPNAAATEVRIAALASERLPARLAAAPSLYDARRLYASAAGETIKAVAVVRKPVDASVVRSEDRSIGLYLGSIRPVRPDYWITAATLARLIKRKPDLVVKRHDWRAAATKLADANAKAKDRARAAWDKKANKFAKLTATIRSEKERLRALISVKDGPKSWGRCSVWYCTLVGSPSTRGTPVYTPPRDMDLAQLVEIVGKCTAAAAVRHV